MGALVPERVRLSSCPGNRWRTIPDRCDYLAPTAAQILRSV